MADPKPRTSQPNPAAASDPAAGGAKPPKTRKKLTLSAALRRIELIMEQFSAEAKLKLAEYATMHAKEQQPKPAGETSGT